MFKVRYLFFCVLFFLHACESKHEKANNYVTSAQEHYESGDIESAKIEFNNALNAEADRVDALMGLAIILEKENKWPQYHNFLKRVIELEPNNEKALLRFGTLNLAMGKIDKAIKLTDSLLKISPKNVEGWTLKASIQARLSDKEGANKAIERALETDKNNAEALLLKANLFMAEKKFEQAITVLNQGIASQPENAFFYAIKIRALNELDDYDQAIDVFKKMIALDPANPATYQVLAKQYVQLGKIDLARDTLVDFANSYPSENAILNAVAFHERHYDSKKTESIIAQYKQDYPDIFSLNFLLSDFYLRSGNLEKARSTLTLATEKAPSTTNKLSAKNQLAILELIQKNWGQVDKIVQEILVEDPQNVKAITTQARMELEKNNTEQGIRLLRSALNDDSENTFVLYLLGKAHEQQGINSLADNHYQRAVLLSNYNTDFSLGYAQFLLKTGKTDQAEELLEKVPLSGKNNVEILEELAKVKLRLSKWDDVERIAKTLESTEGGKATSSQMMGIVFSGRNEMEKSIEAFKMSYEQSPNKLRPLLSLISSYLKTDNVNEAQNLLSNILKSDPDNLYAHILQAKVHLYSGNASKAEFSLKEAVRFHPKEYEAHSNLYDFYRQQNDLAKAETTLQKAVEHLPDSLSLVTKLGVNKEAKNDLLGAQKVYEDWLKKSPMTSVINNNLAAILLRSDQITDQQRALELAKKLSTSNVPHFKDTLGWAHFVNNNIEPAMRFLDDASQDLNGTPEFDYHFGMVHLARNEIARGISLLKQSIGNNDHKNAYWLPSAKAALAKAEVRLKN